MVRLGTVEEVLNKDNLIETLKMLEEQELDKVRYLLITGIRYDGSAFSVGRGQVSGVELSGLPVVVEEYVLDEIQNLRSQEGEQEDDN